MEYCLASLEKDVIIRACRDILPRAAACMECSGGASEYKLKKTIPSDTSRESSVSREPLNVNKIKDDEPNVPNKQDSDDDSDS